MQAAQRGHFRTSSEGSLSDKGPDSTRLSFLVNARARLLFLVNARARPLFLVNARARLAFTEREEIDRIQFVTLAQTALAKKTVLLIIQNSGARRHIL